MSLEPVVAVAIGVLATIFVISMVVVIVICKYRCRRKDLITQATAESRPSVTLVENMEVQGELELDDVKLGPDNIDEILKDEAWIDDVTGLIPHCLAILKTCHLLTEKLVAMTMRGGGQLRTPETHTDIIATAKRISPRVDAVVTCMYPPLDPRLLEARCTALVLSVSHLVLITKHALKLSVCLDWIDQSLADVEEHLQVLREASIQIESNRQIEDNINDHAGSSRQHPTQNRQTSAIFITQTPDISTRRPRPSHRKKSPMQIQMNGHIAEGDKICQNNKTSRMQSPNRQAHHNRPNVIPDDIEETEHVQ